MPPEKQRDVQFGKRYLLRNIKKLIPLALSFLPLWYGMKQDKLDSPSLWLGITMFVISIGYWMWSDKKLFAKYHCPQCGRHLPEPTIKHRTEGDPLTYICPTCNIEWDTMLRE